MKTSKEKSKTNKIVGMPPIMIIFTMVVTVVVYNYVQNIQKKNDPQYQYNQGDMYYYGEGVTQDYEEAFRWYQKAAERGLANAQFNLGWMYRKGEGVMQDNQQAVKWYRKAADQGHTDAQSALLSINKHQVGETFRDCAMCPEMIVVPAGKFMMGSSEIEEGIWSDEGPQHQVTISQPFAVGKYEVTVGQFAEFIRKTNHSVDYCYDEADYGSWHNPSALNQTDNHPVVCVSWHDGQAYLEWLSAETGQNYRLLSESEWEYAARAGTTTTYYFGSTISRSQANFEDSHIHGTALVGSYPANTFGLYDMHGNVGEWVEDCWDGDYYNVPTDGSAWETDDCGPIRLLRGGSWGDDPGLLRSAVRNRDIMTNRDYLNGFRVARTLTP